MTTIDFNPQNPNIIYAGGQAKNEGSSPGVWKTKMRVEAGFRLVTSYHP